MGTAKFVVNDGRLCTCSFVHVTAVHVFVSLTAWNLNTNEFFLFGGLSQMLSQC